MGLISSIENIGSGIANYFTGGGKDADYPGAKYAWSEVFYQNPNEVASLQQNWNTNPGYSFMVVKKDTNNNSGGNVAYIGSGTFGEFVLNINPQNISMREPFAIDIMPTQTGVVTQHSGSVIKEIVIAGTTGVFPGRGPGGVTPTNILPGVGLPSFLTSGTGVMNGNRPGFYHFHMLRNYIRAYVQCKTQSGFQDQNLVFRNKKDGEDWIVEPMDFTMERSSRSPFTYSYRITLRALAKATITSTVTLSSGFGQLLNGLQTIEGVIRGASNLINTGAAILNASAGYITQISQQFNSLVLGPVNAVANLLAGVKNAENAILAVPKSFISDTNVSVTNLLRRVEDLTGCGDSSYNTLVGRTNTAPDTKASRVPTVQEIGIMEALSTIQDGLTQLLATDLPFSKDLLNDSSYNMNAFNVFLNVSMSSADKVSMKKGSIQSIEKMFNNQLVIKQPASATVDIVRSGETIPDIAVRTLGDVNRWYDIVLLNQLKYPYIDTTEDKTLGVLAVGSSIYIPSDNQVINKGVVRGRTTYITENMSEVEKSLGVDLQLTGDNDLRVNSRNDFDLIAGAQNAGQAIYIDLELEQGSLKYHPNKGVNLNVGTKSSSAQSIMADIKNSILSDPRFSGMGNSTVTVQNSTVILGLNVQIANLGQEIPLTISV